ncbi:MAG: hypothetical protein U0802_07310 [Candidatus Binatia bacterium]
MMRYRSLAATAGLLLLASAASAGTKVQGNVVANDGASHPQVSSKSKFKIDGAGNYQVGLKGITITGGMPAPVTTGTTPDTQYWIILKGDNLGVLWQLNVPFNITKEGQAKVKGSNSLITSVPTGSAVGILGVEIREPTPGGSAAACSAIMNKVVFPGVYIPPGDGPSNPCATGARIGLSGIVTE